MVPMQSFALEQDSGENGKDNQRDDLLNDLQLHQRERASIAGKAHAVGRDLKRIFSQGYAPRKQNHRIQRPAGRHLHLLQLQVAIPGKGHEDV